MPVESRHPDYQGHIRDWEACRDVYDGQTAVRARELGHRYLPPTTGQWLDGMGNEQMPGQRAYAAYRDRALLSGFFADAMDTFMGMLWHRPPTLELGPLEQYFGDGKPATADGRTLMQLLRCIHAEQLTIGRCGLLGDLPAVEATTPAPYIELYTAESIINWNDGVRVLARRMLNLVVLDECGPIMRESLDWEHRQQYRVLALGPVPTLEESGVYQVAVVRQAGALDTSALEAPTVFGKTLDEIPFVFVGAKSITTAIDQPPFIALAHSVLALWRMDADYRLSLHLNVGDTLMTKCADKDEVTSVGPGAHINIANPKGDAKFIGMSGNGLGEMRQALENEQVRCAKRAGEMLAENSKARESADAQAHRTGVKGTRLIDIALTAADGLQKMLRILARWLGASDAEAEKIVVTPNKEWASMQFASKTLMELVQAYVLGAPITLESIHAYNVQHGYTTLTWDEMVAAKRDEAELISDLLPMPPPTVKAPLSDNNPELTGGVGG